VLAAKSSVPESTSPRSEGLGKDGPSATSRLTAIAHGCWFATVGIGNENVEMLVDTGSSVSLISMETYERLRPQPRLQPVGSALRTAGGEAMTLYGKIELELGLREQIYGQEIVVAALGGLSGILGLDFLHENDVLLDAGNGVLKMSGCNVWLHRENADRCARVRVSETVRIPARSEICLKGLIDGAWNDQTDGIIEPVKNFVKKNGLILPKMLVNAKQSCVAISVMNLLDKPVRLDKGTILGNLQPVADVCGSCASEQGESTEGKKNNDSKLPEHLKPVVDNCTALSDEQREKVSSVLTQYSDVFVGPDGKLGHTTIVNTRLTQVLFGQSNYHPVACR
jgi:hypothetical protein